VTAVVVYVGLGANLGDPRRQILAALEALATLGLPGSLRRSRLYCTAPLGPPGQPDYLNAVAAMDTELEPRALLEQLQWLEQRAGRERRIRWDARTLDLDLLLYGARRIDRPGLTVPHPRIAERAFVLLPLADLDASLQIPGQGQVAALLAACPPLRAEPVAWDDGPPAAIAGS
jgi:2-amino-4-hydroxy-6-hydroxymethyldihydropteridine diphosphokinase